MKSIDNYLSKICIVSFVGLFLFTATQGKSNNFITRKFSYMNSAKANEIPVVKPKIEMKTFKPKIKVQSYSNKIVFE